MGNAVSNAITANALPRSGGSLGTNNLPPLGFHQVHGENIRVSNSGAVAHRTESFCKGVTFSSRPVKVNEKVYVKFLEVSTNWSGVMRFGFTSNDPSNLRHSLPKYACPDLTNKPGYWAKALNERYCDEDSILFYYVSPAGDVHFGINGEEKGIFFSGVDTRGLLWALIDVYGNSTAIEFIDWRQYLNNSRRSLNYSIHDQEMERWIQPTMSALSISNPPPPPSIPIPPTPHTPPPPPPPPPQVNRTPTYTPHHTPPHSLPLTPSAQQQNSANCTPVRYHGESRLTPIPFHRMRGRNVCLSNDGCIAWRSETEFSHGYVFTGRPLYPGETLLIQVLGTATLYVGSLAFGLTSCDPSGLEIQDLPEDSDLLLDRPEYWVVKKDVANTPQQGDELAFQIRSDGAVQFWRNGGAPTVLMHVDDTLRLWAFFDIYGNTQKIRILSQGPNTPARDSSCRARLSLPLTPPPLPPPNSIHQQQQQQQQQQQSHMLSNCQQQVAHHTHSPIPSSHTAANLVVSLPVNSSPIRPPSQCFHNSPSTGNTPSALPSSHARLQVSLPPVTSPVGEDYIEPVSGFDPASLGGDQVLGECSVCYENPIDSVLYMCGHMCMCYECAVQQWRGRGCGQCPICRAVIRDVIRTYRS